MWCWICILGYVDINSDFLKDAGASQAFIKHIYIVKIPKQSIPKIAIWGEYCVHAWSFCEKCFLWKHKVIKGDGEREEHNSHGVYGKIGMAFLVTYIAFFPPAAIGSFCIKKLDRCDDVFLALPTSFLWLPKIQSHCTL